MSRYEEIAELTEQVEILDKLLRQANQNCTQAWRDLGHYKQKCSDLEIHLNLLRNEKYGHRNRNPADSGGAGPDENAKVRAEVAYWQERNLEAIDRAIAAEARVAELECIVRLHEQTAVNEDSAAQRSVEYAAASERAAIVAWFRGYGGHCDECNRADTIASAADCEIHSPLDGTYEDIADAIESVAHLKRDGGEGREDGHCDECDPSFGCFSGETMCCKRSLAQRDGGEG